MREKKIVTFYPVIYRMLQVTLIAAIVVAGIGSYVGIVTFEGLHLTVGVVTLLLLAWINYGKWNEKIICTAVLVLLVLVIVPVLCSSNVWDFWQNYISWCVAKPEYNVEYVPGYELMQSILVVSICYGFQMLIEKKAILKDIFVLGVLIGLIVCMLTKFEISHKAVVLAICLIVLHYIERHEGKWKLGNPNKGYVLWVLPFMLLYMLLLFKMPVSDKPYDWAAVKKAYAYIKEKVIILIEDIKGGDREDFVMSMNGFSEEGKLKGGIFTTDDILITIERVSGNSTTIYLGGKTYDYFDGRTWEQTVDGSEYISEMDTLETLYALLRYDGDNLRRYMDYNRLSLRYEYFNTGYLFAPAKIRVIEGVKYESLGNDYVFGKQMGYGTEYGLTFYEINQRLPEFSELIESNLPENQEIWNNVVNTYRSNKNDTYTLSQLYEYQNQMVEMYSSEVELSDEVKSYLKEITTGCTTDIQRLQAIEKALSGYEYTKTPGELPESVNSPSQFLDYFLLESKKGYCSYYATAFVLLARAEGLPARYVEGFCVTDTGEKNLVATGDMLHAWPEVYIKNVGWIAFEPTPGYGTMRYSNWTWIDTQDYVGGDYYEEEEDVVDVTEEEIVEDTTASSGRKPVITTLIVILEVTVLCILLFLLEVWIMHRRYLAKSLSQQFLAYVRRNLWIWSRLGYRRNEAETLEELYDRVCQGMPYVMKEKDAWSFINIYQEYLYRDEEITKESFEETIRESKILLSWLKKERKWQYLLVRLRSAVQWGLLR